MINNYFQDIFRDKRTKYQRNEWLNSEQKYATKMMRKKTMNRGIVKSPNFLRHQNLLYSCKPRLYIRHGIPCPILWPKFGTSCKTDIFKFWIPCSVHCLLTLYRVQDHKFQYILRVLLTHFMFVTISFWKYLMQSLKI